MQTAWYVLVAFMLVGYVVLDGFDIGAGILHLFIARSDQERRLLISTIGPVWDGNEVWLLAAGGTMYFAFPLLYASGFSGFYLPLHMVLWLLIFRAIGIELRAHLDNAVWRGFFDGAFGIASLLLAVFYGAALGNVIRGVPLGPDAYFFAPLWTNWRVGPEPGILDWYTVLAAITAVVALVIHGAHYVALKTAGELNQRARAAAAIAWPVLVVFTTATLVATIHIRPSVTANFRHQPLALVIPVVVFGSVAAMLYFRVRGREKAAFLSSAVYLGAMLGGAAIALYPTVLPASTDPKYNLTIYNSATGLHSLSVGLRWWLPGMALAIGYFVFVYWMFRGKVSPDSGGQAH